MRKRALGEAEAAAVRDNAAGMSERQRRLYLGSVSSLRGRGWDTAVAEAAGASRATVARGRLEWEAGERHEPGGRERAPGAGRPSLERLFAERERGPDDPTDLVAAVGDVLDARGYGDPCGDGPVHTSVTARGVASEVLRLHCFKMSERAALRLCHKAGYSMQRNAKEEQVGDRHPLREAQFLVIDELAGAYEAAGVPVGSVDTKAKVKLGNFAAPGRGWARVGSPRRVKDHDFALTYAQVYGERYPDGHPELDPGLWDRLAVVSPYGFYDVANNVMHITLGVGSDTSEFACAAIQAWWEACGRQLWPDADELFMLADGGGSNRACGWLLKYELALMLLRCGLRAVTMAHYPPGTSKYNPIEHKGWSPVESTRRGIPVIVVEHLQGLYEQATTSTGLRVTCGIDWRDYPTEARRRREMAERGLSPSRLPAYRERFDAIATIERPFTNETLSQWNYRIELIAD